MFIFYYFSIYKQIQNYHSYELEIVCHKTKFKSKFKTQFTVLLHVAKILGQNTKHYLSDVSGFSFIYTKPILQPEP